MKNLILLFLILSFNSYSQNILEFNFDAEKIEANEDLPEGWFRWGKPAEYHMEKDSETVYQGESAIKLEHKTQKGTGSFACAAYKIPATYEGKNIELTGYFKTKDAAHGHVGLLLRLDGDGGSLGFDNMQDRAIQGTNDWKKYSIKMPFQKGAKKIFIGGIMVGTGTAWFDDFDILIDGVSVKKLKTVEPQLLPAQMDKEFDEGSKIEAIKLTPENTQHLATLGKLWGFVKYYHPKIATGDINWDYELFRVLPTYLEAKSNQERAEVLENWINKLGEFEMAKLPEPEGELKIRANYDWFGETKNDALILLLTKIKKAKRTGKHYQLSFASNIGNPKINNESLYQQFKYPDIGFRLIALYRYWNIINYFFPYKYLTDDNWDQVLLDFVPRFINAKNELEYNIAMLELIGKVQDTHANIWRKNSSLRDFLGKKISVVKVKMVEDKAMVVGFHDEEKGKNSALKFGDIITYVNGKSIDDIIQEKLPYLPASNYPTQMRDFVNLLLRTNEDKLEVTYLRNEEEKNSTLTLFPTEEIRTFSRPQIDSWKVLEGDIGYIYPETLKEGDQEKIKNTLFNKKGIVIDLRCYPSEFIVFTFGNKLTPNSKDFVKFTTGSLIQPGNFTFTTTLSVGSKNAKCYPGKVAILINEGTQSQAEYTTMAFQTAPNNKIFGSTTAGADGNVSGIPLPGNIRTMISGIGVYYPDGKETQRIGIVPDVVVKPTIKGMMEDRDEVLEKALEWINEK